MSFQGPVLSAHKKLWGEKLAEEEAEKKVKGEAKKEKHLVFHLTSFRFFTYMCCVHQLYVIHFVTLPI